MKKNVLCKEFHSYFYLKGASVFEVAPKSADLFLAVAGSRVIARISKMPVQNSNFKIFASPDLASYLLQILIPATFNSLLCQKGN